jgi:hypothetical protein
MPYQLQIFAGCSIKQQRNCFLVAWGFLHRSIYPRLPWLGACLPAKAGPANQQQFEIHPNKRIHLRTTFAITKK